MVGWDLDEVYAIQEASLHAFKQLPREVDVYALYNFYSKNLRTWFVTKQKYLRGQNLQVTNLSLILCYYMVSSSSTKFSIFFKIPQVCQRSDPWLTHGMTQFPKNRLPRVHLNHALRHREGCQCRKAIGAAELTLAAMLPRRIHPWWVLKKMIESSSKDILDRRKKNGVALLRSMDWGVKKQQSAMDPRNLLPVAAVEYNARQRLGTVFFCRACSIFRTCLHVDVYVCIHVYIYIPYIYILYMCCICIYIHTVYVLCIYICTHTLHICICVWYMYVYIYTYIHILVYLVGYLRWLICLMLKFHSSIFSIYESMHMYTVRIVYVVV